VDSVIPFPDASFDLIYAIEVLEHTFRPYDFFKQAFAKLKKGGHLIVTVPNSLHFKSRLSFLFSGFAEMFGPCSTREKNAGRICGHIMPLNYANFVYALRTAGFSEMEFARDRTKKSSMAWSLVFYPFLKIASVLYDRGLRAYDKEVWEENRDVVYRVNSLDVLTSRSCIMIARKA
jgi:SAM-dependent methyltransferase